MNVINFGIEKGIILGGRTMNFNFNNPTNSSLNDTRRP